MHAYTFGDFFGEFVRSVIGFGTVCGFVWLLWFAVDGFIRDTWLPYRTGKRITRKHHPFRKR